MIDGASRDLEARRVVTKSEKGRMRRTGVRWLVPALWLVSPVAWAGSTEWFLMGRHGECAPLSVLGRKNSAWSQVANPHEFIAQVRAAGHGMDVREHDMGGGTAIQVDVPALELSLVFVGRGACRNVIDRPR